MPTLLSSFFLWYQTSSQSAKRTPNSVHGANLNFGAERFKKLPDFINQASKCHNGNTVKY